MIVGCHVINGSNIQWKIWDIVPNCKKKKKKCPNFYAFNQLWFTWLAQRKLFCYIKVFIHFLKIKPEPNKSSMMFIGDNYRGTGTECNPSCDGGLSWVPGVLKASVLIHLSACATFSLCSFRLTMTAVICWSMNSRMVTSRAGMADAR